MVYVNDGYIMLLDALMFNDKKIGVISDEGIDWGGDSAEYIKLWGAQVRNAPVKKIKKKDGTNILKFTLIELLPQNCKDVMGGTVNGARWDAPADSVSLTGALKILAGTGQTIDIKNMTLDGSCAVRSVATVLSVSSVNWRCSNRQTAVLPLQCTRRNPSFLPLRCSSPLPKQGRARS